MRVAATARTQVESAELSLVERDKCVRGHRFLSH